MCEMKQVISDIKTGLEEEYVKLPVSLHAQNTPTVRLPKKKQ